MSPKLDLRAFKALMGLGWVALIAAVALLYRHHRDDSYFVTGRPEPGRLRARSGAGHTEGSKGSWSRAASRAA